MSPFDYFVKSASQNLTEIVTSNNRFRLKEKSSFVLVHGRKRIPQQNDAFHGTCAEKQASLVFA